MNCRRILFAALLAGTLSFDAFATAQGASSENAPDIEIVEIDTVETEALTEDKDNEAESTVPITDEQYLVSLGSVPQGIYEIASAADPDFILDVKHCTVQDTDSQTLQLYYPLDVNQQKFYLEDLPGVACRFSALHSGGAMTAGETSVSTAAMEHPEEAAAAFSQSWKLKPAGDGSYYIQAHDGRYLTADVTRPYLGAPVILSDFAGTAGQRWLLSAAWVSAEDCGDTDFINPYGEGGQYSQLRIALKFGSKYEILDSAALSEHMMEVNEHELTLDPEFLPAYVQQLAEKYDTQNIERRFHTSHGEDIVINNGNFGWKLDEGATLALLQESLTLTCSKTLRPVWSHEGNEFGVENDIGDSYVEVDLADQKVWLYKDGKQLLETDCVTGTADTANATPTGIYSIYYMQSPDVLSGPGYDSYVEYWMAFFGNYGLHDANWRGEFGGDIFRSNGSHGCVNLPTDAAALIYETVSYGYPVIVY